MRDEATIGLINDSKIDRGDKPGQWDGDEGDSEVDASTEMSGLLEWLCSICDDGTLQKQDRQVDGLKL